MSQKTNGKKNEKTKKKNKKTKKKQTHLILQI